MTTNNSWNNSVSNANVSFTGGTMSIGTDNTDHAVNIGTAASAGRPVAVGSTTGTSSLDLKTGTGDFTLASATGTIISALDTGQCTYPLQPRFTAFVSTSILNVTGDNTVYTIVFDTEDQDIGSNYNNTTGVFTVPKTGTYLFNTNVLFVDIGAAHTLLDLNLAIAGSKVRAARLLSINPGVAKSAANGIAGGGSLIINLTQADTVSVYAQASGSTKTIDIFGAAGGFTFFSGQLIS